MTAQNGDLTDGWALIGFADAGSYFVVDLDCVSVIGDSYLASSVVWRSLCALDCAFGRRLSESRVGASLRLLLFPWLSDDVDSED